MKKPSLVGRKIGEYFLFCPGPECNFQLPPGTLAKPVCPQCGKSLHVWQVDEDDLLMNSNLTGTTHGAQD